MSAYFIVYMDGLDDPARLDEYRKVAGPTLKTSKGRIMARNGKFEALEGILPKSVIMLEFPTMDDAKEWYFSPLYQEALKIRKACSECRVMLVEGT